MRRHHIRPASVPPSRYRKPYATASPGMEIKRTATPSTIETYLDRFRKRIRQFGRLQRHGEILKSIGLLEFPILRGVLAERIDAHARRVYLDRRFVVFGQHARLEVLHGDRLLNDVRFVLDAAGDLLNDVRFVLDAAGELRDARRTRTTDFVFDGAGWGGNRWR
ncbi:hypothetical protein QE152_g6303 [Popillia japonica]|uniref:Uncharacterized protein n=1 Tax=Popillia japonica TaxID=7064 RepID=A0AAW1MFZ6_POPJA